MFTVLLMKVCPETRPEAHVNFRNREKLFNILSMRADKRPSFQQLFAGRHKWSGYAVEFGLLRLRIRNSGRIINTVIRVATRHANTSHTETLTTITSNRLIFPSKFSFFGTIIPKKAESMNTKVHSA
ncbi:hypothetical protein AAHC03_05808 [Spirometra sp. Aus1]